MILLKDIFYVPPDPLPPGHPFDIPALEGFRGISLKSPVSFLTGENGSGKSTFLEAVAVQAGFHAEGGGRNASYQGTEATPPLAAALRLSWHQKALSGFFFRAESFFDYASYIDILATDDPEAWKPYGGQSLHLRSHGESFISLFQHRLTDHRPALYLFDEPEAALSVTGQLAFLRMLHDWDLSGHVQAMIATHSPILLAYPKATIWSFDELPVAEVLYRDTPPYKLTRSFLESPERFLRQVFEKD